MICLGCSIPMIGIGSASLLCVRCSQENPGLVEKAEKEVMRELREEAKEQRRLREVDQRRATMRSS